MKDWSLWLFASLFLMILYEIYRIRYFRSKRKMRDFYRDLLWIPVAGATGKRRRRSPFSEMKKPDEAIASSGF